MLSEQLEVYTIAPLRQQYFAKFRMNRRGWWSLWLLLLLFSLSLVVELIANDRPLLVKYKGSFYFPVLTEYAETDFGGIFPSTANYRDAFLVNLISKDGWMLWPLIRFSYDTVNYDLPVPAPAPPSSENWLGTDDQGRDVLARLIYGLRTSFLFGLILTVISSVIGVAAGAVQGYCGGWVDLCLQRFIEIWCGLPQLFILIIISSVVEPGFWTLLLVLMLCNWVALVGVVRAEFLRTRNLGYVRAARALGMKDSRIMFKHILPNAMVATLTYMPFILSGSIVALTALDFLGLGLPPGSASLGDLLRQGKDNLQAPWLSISGFSAVSLILSLLVLVGESIRDALDPRHNAYPKRMV
jgi:microcin C transport system permease protein